MKREKRDKKMEEIKVLDKGKNMDDTLTPTDVCCNVLIIPLRGY